MTWGIAFRARQYLKGSLWVVPLLGALAGPLLAQLDLRIEQHITLPESWTYSESTAATVLSAVVASMIGLTGIVVAIGVLVVQMATGTLSARYMRLWYRDPLQKAVLGSFIGSFAFAYSLLRRVGPTSVPSLGVSMAGVAVAVSLVLFLLYLDRFIHRLRPVAVAAFVAGTGRKVLIAVDARRRPAGGPAVDPVAEDDHVLAVPTPRPGVLQAIDLKGLVGLGRRQGVIVQLHYAVGDYVPEGATLLSLRGGAMAATTPKRAQGLFALGQERTIEQDPAFALRIIVDIAIRALSPAVNDPTTAVQLLDHVEALLQLAGEAEIDERLELCDEDGVVRLVAPVRGWAAYFALGVTEIREYGATSTQVTRRLQAMYQHLLDVVRPEHRAVVEDEMARLDADLRALLSDPERRAYAATPDRQGIGGITDERAAVAQPLGSSGSGDAS
ncbi:DUF2254 domain-containing protein [Baekduia sp.]|uniref:DUF2254 domain-containing protein n=1 Tax=Baekduia sp. TaxID=2600305 RepID=UPI002DFE49C5|nr:DUF2254 domain-containing protein [Baekduia sp.]